MDLDGYVVCEHLQLDVIADGIVRGPLNEENTGGDRGGIQGPRRHPEFGPVCPVGEDALEDGARHQDGARRAKARCVGQHAENVDDHPEVEGASEGVSLAGPGLDGALARRHGQDAGGGEGAIPIAVVGEVHEKILGSEVVEVPDSMLNLAAMNSASWCKLGT